MSTRRTFARAPDQVDDRRLEWLNGFVDAAPNNVDGSHAATFFLGDRFVPYHYDRDRVDDGVHPASDLGFP